MAESVGVTFGKLFDDEEGQQFFEAIVGTLRAAKKRGVVDFKGQVCDQIFWVSGLIFGAAAEQQQQQRPHSSPWPHVCKGKHRDCRCFGL